MMKIAVFPGSFDPITVGHCDIARRAARLFDKVVVLVAKNSQKHTLFDEGERLEMARAAFREDADISVELCEGTVADAALRLGACCIVKGLRDSVDYAVESHFCGAMRALGNVEVVLLDVHKEYADVSSTFVRELYYYDKPKTDYVPAGALELSESFYKAKH